MREPSAADRNDADRRTSALMGFIVILLLAIAGIILVRELAKNAKLEDCLMSGRRNCAPIEVPLWRGPAARRPGPGVGLGLPRRALEPPVPSVLAGPVPVPPAALPPVPSVVLVLPPPAVEPPVPSVLAEPVPPEPAALPPVPRVVLVVPPPALLPPVPSVVLDCAKATAAVP